MEKAYWLHVTKQVTSDLVKYSFLPSNLLIEKSCLKVSSELLVRRRSQNFSKSNRMVLTGDVNNLLKVPRIQGKNIDLVKLELALHLQPLWEAQTKYKETSANPDEDLIWETTRYGPFLTIEEYKQHLVELLALDNFHPFVIEYKGDCPAYPVIVGLPAYCEIVPEHRKCSMWLWLDPRYRRRNIMDEAIYLMLKHAFDVAKYRRVQWRCDTRNESSKKLALRMQFKFEGVIRNELITKGINRDNNYLSVIDSEWEIAKEFFQNNCSYA